MKNRNNTAELSGIVKTAPVLGHNIYKEDFYHFELMIPRLSGVSDVLPVTLSGKLSAAYSPAAPVPTITASYRLSIGTSC